MLVMMDALLQLKIRLLIYLIIRLGSVGMNVMIILKKLNKSSNVKNEKTKK